MPTPIRWSVPIDLSTADAAVAAKVQRRGKFYVFLRAIRHELFDEAFQAELAAVYQPPAAAGAAGDGAAAAAPMPRWAMPKRSRMRRWTPGGNRRWGAWALRTRRFRKAH